MKFNEFMRREIKQYSVEYARQRVLIHPNKTQFKNTKGGVMLFLHFGSFFLSGAALIHQLGLKYTAIASTRNFKHMPDKEEKFWRKTHETANELYSKKMFLTHEPHTREIISFLKSGSFLGAALDVTESGQKHKLHPYKFLHNEIMLQTGPARLARMARVPLYGMIIVHDKKAKKHDLHVTGPHSYNEIEKSTQEILHFMEPHVEKNMDQLFHDIFHLFSRRSTEEYMIAPVTRKKPASFKVEPIPQIDSKLPTNFAPRYESEITSWHPHREFAYQIIEEIRPNLIVELGVHYGDSYFTFCQASEELELDAEIYGIDHWEGDEQCGFYGDEVFQEVNAYNEEFYSKDSTLMRMNFTDALTRFDDGSIDLLHIDGSHDYEAVKQDFENWLPKVKKGGKILIHDILVEREDFGVKVFWEQTSKNYKTASHLEGFGLGVIFC
jgi:predicted O-methyltransferase YrrM